MGGEKTEKLVFQQEHDEQLTSFVLLQCFDSNLTARTCTSVRFQFLVERRVQSVLWQHPKAALRELVVL